MKKTAIFCALALIAAIAMPAFAEVQNVKLSGEITMRGFYRDNYYTTGSGGGTPATLSVNLGRRDLVGATSNTFANAKSEDWYMQTTKLAVDADLTDNVSTNITFFSESDWPTTETTAGHSNTGTTAAEKFDIELLYSYVTLKEMLYSPLTIKIGRQPVWLGRGLILGDGDFSGNGLIASDYSSSNGFDAIAGILDYDPLTLILGTLKVSDADTTTGDFDGYFFDSIYKFDSYNAVLDIAYLVGYYASPAGGSTSGPAGTSREADSVQGIDVIISGDPIQKLNSYLEYGKQFGDYTSDPSGASSRDLDAWALDLGATYAFDNKLTPLVGLEYGFRSGAKASTTTGDYEGWIPFFEGQKHGEILDPNSNASWIKLSGSIKPAEKITTGVDYYNYWLDEKVVTADTSSRKTKTDLGDEVDLSVKYAYTDDVTFGFLLASFWPGSSYAEGNDKTAMEAIGSVNVKF